jgi:hypothetical protein
MFWWESYCILQTFEIIMAQYVGTASSVVKCQKCAVHCCLLCNISETGFCTIIPSAVNSEGLNWVL